MKPQILVANDDGIQSPGLQALASALSGLGDVTIVAPDRQRSASSHCITVDRSLRYREVGPRRFSVAGTPADCVIVAAVQIMKVKPALVVSGVNRGLNVGDDLCYSGTVAAASEGILQGIPSIAVSTWGPKDQQQPPDFTPSSVVAGRVAERVLQRGLPPEVLLNINFPERWNGKVMVTRQGRRAGKPLLVQSLTPKGETHFWLDELHSHVSGSPDDAMTDHDAIDAGYVSISPVHIDRTAHRHLQRFSKWMDGIDWS